MKDLFGSMGDPSLSIGRGMHSLLFGLMTMESGYEGLLKQAQEALRFARFSFQPGASSRLEVLNAQRAKRDIVQDYAQDRFDRSVSPVRLERGMGGLS